MNMMSEKSISAEAVASGPTRVNQLPPEMTAGHDHLNIFSVAQFHGHIHGVCDDGNAAEHFKTPNHFGCGGATCQCDGLAGADEFGSRED